MVDQKHKVLPNIRIRKITLTDFRNIRYSEIDLPNGKVDDFRAETPSVLGLYGQNGSGKTSLLMAIDALKTALTGSVFNYRAFSSCIRSGATHARLEFEFSAYYENAAQFDIYYGFSLSIEQDKKAVDTKPSEKSDEEAVLNAYLDETYNSGSKGNNTLPPKEGKIIVSDEVLQFGGIKADGKKVNKQIIIDTSDAASQQSGKAFGNKLKYDQLTANCSSEIHKNLSDWKTEARIKSTSYIFNQKVFRNIIFGSSMMSYKLILATLSDFGRNNLFVIMTAETAYNSMKVLPFAVWAWKENKTFGRTYPLKLTDHCQVYEEDYKPVVDALSATSNVISQIVPGLSVEISDIGETTADNGDEVHLFDLISNRNGVRIPLQYESDGIRRIISFLSLLIAVYNDPTVTVAVDEIDSGIFEYMLGEILSILGESAKGQLIFTSHNLRPLEVLPPKFLLFTTVNPERRFAKLEGISGNNNLRDCYFRTIDLGVGKDAFYDATDTFNIEQALFEAGHPEEQ